MQEKEDIPKRVSIIIEYCRFIIILIQNTLTEGVDEESELAALYPFPQ